MFRRYGHGHSIGVGVLIGVLLERHLFAYGLACVLLGVILGRSWLFWAHIADAARKGIVKSARARIRTRPEPDYRGKIPF
jgi:hypothetical protein